MNIFLETDRLLMREIYPADDFAMFELDSDPEVHRYLGDNPIYTIQEARQNIEFIRKQYVSNGIGRWAVIEKSTNNFIGWAGLKFIQENVNDHTNYYDLGYRFKRDAWSKGYATESAKVVLNYGFNVLKLKNIYAMADVRNVASKNVLEKAGLKYVDSFCYKYLIIGLRYSCVYFLIKFSILSDLNYL